MLLAHQFALHCGDRGGEARVVDGATADEILVAAKGSAGIGLYAVDATAPGVTRTPLFTMDLTRPAIEDTWRSLRSVAAPGTELVFVEGHSTDGTFEKITKKIEAENGKQIDVLQGVLDKAAKMRGDDQKAMMAEAMSRVTGGLKIPGLGG